MNSDRISSTQCWLDLLKFVDTEIEQLRGLLVEMGLRP